MEGTDKGQPLLTPEAFRLLEANKGRIDPGEMARLWVMIDDLNAIPWRSLRHLLDAGCGRGVMSFYLLWANPDLRATLVDVKEAYAFGRDIFFPSRQPETRYRFEHLSLHQWRGATRYDLVLCVHVLEHIVHWQPVVHDLWASVAPGGYLYLQTPSAYPSPNYPTGKVIRTNLQQRLSRVFPRQVRSDGVFHVRHGFSCKTLKDTGDTLGAKLVSAKEQYLGPPWSPVCPFKPLTSITLRKPG